MNDTYTATVTFKRSLAEDLDMARQKYPGRSDQEALQLQLRDELQEACDAGMAGEFNVDRVELPTDKPDPALSWGVPLPAEIGEGGVLRLDRLLYRKVWEHSRNPEGGFVAIFQATRTDTGVSGWLRWSYEYAKRDVTNNVVEASVPGFEGVFDFEGPDVWLDVHIKGDYGTEPSGVDFPHHVFGDE